MLTEPAASLPERGERLLAAFRNAVLLPDDSRRRFLEEIEAEDPGLRAEIEALLTADDGIEDGFLEAPAQPGLADLDEDSDDEATGRRIGPYMILRLLGRGGMGSVYLAHRSDVDKQVAVKLLDTIFTSTDAGRRFLLERTVLARLDHPNIARLLDAGIFPPSTPYFAMEYVDGEPITDYAARVDVEAQLRLFEAVCSATAYAHQHLVVHRDLKPSNILVDRSGGVKLVDFGIAKLLEDDYEQTGTGLRLMTPESAAPSRSEASRSRRPRTSTRSDCCSSSSSRARARTRCAD